MDIIFPVKNGIPVFGIHPQVFSINLHFHFEHIFDDYS